MTWDAPESRMLLFRLGERTLALESQHARGVMVPEQVTPLPGVGPVLLGLLAVNGQNVPLIDLGVLLDLPADEAAQGAPHTAPHTAPHMVAVAEVSGQWFAFPIDEAHSFAAGAVVQAYDRLLAPAAPVGERIAERLNAPAVLSALHNSISRP